MSKSMYDMIKRQNGEAFAKEIRNFDNQLFEIENLKEIVRYAGRQARDLLLFLEGLKTKEIARENSIHDPFFLLQAAGYDAFLADTLEKQNMIAPYFKKGEELCTFMDKTRFLRYHIIHCIKRGAELLNRDDFMNIERREDAYGSSVISIQILKTGGFISIKNRYNHTVSSPDNTFNSNPDNIIPGLSASLKNYFGVDFYPTNVQVPNGYVFQKGRIFKFNYEKNNIYVGDNFFLKDGCVKPLNLDYQLMVNGFVLDFKDKKVINPAKLNENLVHVIHQEIMGNDLSIQKRNGVSLVFLNKKPFLTVKEGRLTNLNLYQTKNVENLFQNDRYIEEFFGEKVLSVMGKSFCLCPNLKKVSLPLCVDVDEKSFSSVSADIDAPLLKEMGVSFLSGIGIHTQNKKILFDGVLPHSLVEFLNPYLKGVDDILVQREGADGVIFVNKKPLFHIRDKKLIAICFPDEITRIDAGVLSHMPTVETVVGNNVAVMEEYNLYQCPELKTISLPRVRKMGLQCVMGCASLKEVCFPMLETVSGHGIMTNNISLKRVVLPNCEDMFEMALLPKLDEIILKNKHLKKQKAFIVYARGLPRGFVPIVKENERDA